MSRVDSTSKQNGLSLPSSIPLDVQRALRTLQSSVGRFMGGWTTRVSS